MSGFLKVGGNKLAMASEEKPSILLNKGKHKSNLNVGEFQLLSAPFSSQKFPGRFVCTLNGTH